MGERAPNADRVPGSAEGEHLPALRLARALPASPRRPPGRSRGDRHEAIGDAGLRGGLLDVRRERLVRLLAVGPVVDQIVTPCSASPATSGERPGRSPKSGRRAGGSWLILLVRPSRRRRSAGAERQRRDGVPAGAGAASHRRSARNNRDRAGCSDRGRPSRGTSRRGSVLPRDRTMSRKRWPLARVRPPCFSNAVERVLAEHARPGVGVIARRIAVAPDVEEVARAIARRHDVGRQPALLQARPPRTCRRPAAARSRAANASRDRAARLRAPRRPHSPG